MVDGEQTSRQSRLQARWSAFSDRYLFEDTIKRHSGRWAPRLYRIPLVVPALLITVVLVAWSVFVFLAYLSGFHITWWHPKFGVIKPDNRGDLLETRSPSSLSSAPCWLRSMRIASSGWRKLQAIGRTLRDSRSATKTPPSSWVTRRLRCGWLVSTRSRVWPMTGRSNARRVSTFSARTFENQ